MKILVDDQLMLAANLGVLDLPPGTDLPLLAVYGFWIRVANALVGERATEGTLQRLVKEYRPDGVDLATIVSPASEALSVVDPTQDLVMSVHIRTSLRCNQLAAEVVSCARTEEAQVALTPGNSRGQLAEVLKRAEVHASVWTLVPTNGRLAVAVDDLP